MSLYFGRQPPIWNADPLTCTAPLTGRFTKTPAARARCSRIRRIFLTDCRGRATLEHVRQRLLDTDPDLIAGLSLDAQKNLIRAVLHQVAYQITAW